MEMQFVPRVGETILVLGASELYHDDGGQSPVWIVTDVRHCVEFAPQGNRCYSVVVFIENDDEPQS